MEPGYEPGHLAPEHIVLHQTTLSRKQGGAQGHLQWASLGGPDEPLLLEAPV